MQDIVVSPEGDHLYTESRELIAFFHEIEESWRLCGGVLYYKTPALLEEILQFSSRGELRSPESLVEKLIERL